MEAGRWEESRCALELGTRSTHFGREVQAHHVREGGLMHMSAFVKKGKFLRHVLTAAVMDPPQPYADLATVVVQPEVSATTTKRTRRLTFKPERPHRHVRRRH